MLRVNFILILFVVYTVSNAQHMSLESSEVLRNCNNNVISSDTKIKFSTYKLADELNKINENELSKNFFGKKAAKYEYLYKKSCIIKTSVAPGNPGIRVIIKKPLIYRSVNKLFKYLKRQVKKGNIDKELAMKQYARVLNIAYASITEDSVNFERELMKSSKPEKILRVFKSVELSEL